MKQLPASDLVLETRRLRLTPYTMDDLDIACRLYGDPQIMRYVGDPMTAAQVAAMMPQFTRRGAGGRLGLWCVHLKHTGQALGDCLLAPVPIETGFTDWTLMASDTWPTGPIEVGYMLTQTAWGQGFATEICARLLRFAFETSDLEEVVAVIDPDNRASRHVLQKCGMQGRGMHRAYATDRAEWLAIARTDWNHQEMQR